MGNNPSSMRSLVGERPAIFSVKKSKILMTRYNFLVNYARHTVNAKNIKNSSYLTDLWNCSNKYKFEPESH
ncbi:Hypothetical predicted protein [Olea europaea subsp. europaea]|uniref:Uncharacterized protein n=1 Tax=Olea europaea subsp. europaea TaxID=158383 RepID=A0A8S0RWU4_OLEEU|nr:Hypothetical predicted protein [Olea europaea subsp. europaea]